MQWAYTKFKLKTKLNLVRYYFNCALLLVVSSALFFPAQDGQEFSVVFTKWHLHNICSIRCHTNCCEEYDAAIKAFIDLAPFNWFAPFAKRLLKIGTHSKCFVENGVPCDTQTVTVKLRRIKTRRLSASIQKSFLVINSIKSKDIIYPYYG